MTVCISNAIITVRKGWRFQLRFERRFRMVVKHRILSIAALLIMTLFLGIGYASITDSLYVSGTAETKPPTTLVIMDVTSISGTNVSSEV